MQSREGPAILAAGERASSRDLRQAGKKAAPKTGIKVNRAPKSTSGRRRACTINLALR